MDYIDLYTHGPEHRIDSLEVSIQLSFVGEGLCTSYQFSSNTLADNPILSITLNRNHRTILSRIVVRNRPDVLGAGSEMGRRSLGGDRATEGAVGRHGERWIVIEGGDDSSLSSSCI